MAVCLLGSSNDVVWNFIRFSKTLIWKFGQLRLPILPLNTLIAPKEADNTKN